MERFQQVLLDVWREACRHIEIAECAQQISELLREHMPLERMLVHWLDVEHKRVVAAAIVPAHGTVAAGELLSERQFRKLAAWVRRGEPVRIGRTLPVAVPLPSVTSPDREAVGQIVAPIRGSHGTLGLVTFTPAHGTRFNAHHDAMIRLLQEPFGVALENDRRLHELAVLREAAEADRRSLLMRLGRQELAETVVGADSGLEHVMERVRQVSRSDVPVLILGETGTGKELIARAIHNSSTRSGGPFIRVNCGAIPPELIDSQLFGHEKGSFTGAVETRQGWFERADGGTLFLDEIGELPADAQVRFLRVLQEGSVERVGGQRDIHVDVRVVAATHRDLAGMVAEGRFREDLWYRIAVFPIMLPPLRERKQDIPALVEHFSRKAATRFGLTPVAASDADLRLLESYDWPGNIRELGTVIDRAAILGDGKSLEIAAALGLARPRPLRTAPSGNALTATTRRDDPVISAIAPLNEVVRRHVEAALEATRGRIEGPYGAAALLEINPHTLRARMRKLGIDWKAYRICGSTLPGRDPL
jgi:hydrogenase-4 transcriptional activator